MKYIFCILIPVLLTGCFTNELTRKARHDKQYETVSRIKYSNIDSSGNLVIIIQKRFSQDEFLLAFNIDSLYKVYKVSGQLDLIFRNTLQTNQNKAIGVFYKDDLPKTYKKPLLLFFSKETIGSNNSIYVPQTDSNYLNIEVYSGKHYMPSDYVDGDYIYNKQKYLTVVFEDFDQTNVRKNPLNRTFVIGIASTKKRKAKYFQLPLTVIADIITFPFQLVVYGVVVLLKS